MLIARDQYSNRFYCNLSNKPKFSTILSFLVLFTCKSAFALTTLSDCTTLNQSGETYVLNTDLSSIGSCLNITASNITLDLAGHSITYDNFPNAGIPNANFEAGNGNLPGNWDLSAAPSAERAPTSEFAMLEDWYLRFSNPSNGEEIVSEWTSLPENSQVMAYLISGISDWQYQDPPHYTLSVEHQSGAIVYSKSFVGFANNLKHEFQSLSSSGNYRLRFRIDQVFDIPTSNGIPMAVAIDHFDLRPAHAVGLSVSQPDVTVKNGSIIQGSGSGPYGYGIFISGNADRTIIDSITSYTSGMTAYNILTSWPEDIQILNSNFTSDTPHLFTRHSEANALTLLNSVGAKIQNNRIESGKAFGCIWLSGSHDSEVFNNICLTESTITNHHGIVNYNGSNLIIRDNVIEATNGGQGILCSTGFSNTQILRNQISLKDIAPNFEYGTFSRDGIRLNDYSSGNSNNVLVSGNNIVITGGMLEYYLPGYSGLNYGKRLNGIMNGITGTNLNVENNTIAVYLNDSDTIGSCIEIGGSTQSNSSTFNNNICASNNINLVVGGYGATAENARFISNRLIRLTPESGTYSTIATVGTSAHIRDVNFVDMNFENGASYDSSYLYTYNSSEEYHFDVDWLLTLQITDQQSNAISNASVTVQDIDGNIAYSTTTNSNGFTSPMQLREYQRFGQAFMQGPQGRRYSTPHSITVTAQGFDTWTSEIVMDKSKSLLVQLSSGNGECIPQWECSDWSNCQDGLQTRSCSDLNNCGDTTDIPPEVRTCIIDSTYYVAENGSDTEGDGSVTHPWRTIGYAASVVPDNMSRILVLDGTYSGVTITRRFSTPTLIEAINPYKAVLSDSSNANKVLEFLGATNITVVGFEITRPEPFASFADGSYMVHIGRSTEGDSENITLENNIFHDNYGNDLLKINNGSRHIFVRGNIFYNQPDVGDEHIDINTVTDITLEDNIFFNDFEGSGRVNLNNTHPYLVIKNSGNAPITRRINVRRNIFLNWQGLNDQAFLLLGEDGKPFYEAQEVLIENNLMIGNSANPIAAALNYKGVKDVTFRANTVVGNFAPSLSEPAGSFAARINLEGENPINSGMSFYNNIWSDPTGTMGRFSNVPLGHAENITIQNNLYWNAGNPVPSGDQEFSIEFDPNAITLDPLLGQQSNLIFPRWNKETESFLSGNITQRQEFERLVAQYGTPDIESAVVDNANPVHAPEHDILGTPRAGRGSAPDIGALETDWTSTPPPSPTPTPTPAPTPSPTPEPTATPSPTPTASPTPEPDFYQIELSYSLNARWAYFDVQVTSSNGDTPHRLEIDLNRQSGNGTTTVVGTSKTNRQGRVQFKFKRNDLEAGSYWASTEEIASNIVVIN